MTDPRNTLLVSLSQANTDPAHLGEAIDAWVEVVCSEAPAGPDQRDDIAYAGEPIDADCFVRGSTRICPPPARVIGAQSLAELKGALEAAVRDGLTVRALAAGHGFSALNHGHDALVDVAIGLDDILPILPDELEPGRDPNRLCRFGGGARIATIQAHLEARGSALFNAPGYEELTFAGVLSVGGHGSGLIRGALAEVVFSVDMLCVTDSGEVELVRVERASSPMTRADVVFDGRLVHDDVVFDAVTCGLGMMGIIVALTIEVAPAYRIEEHRYDVSWDHIEAYVSAALQAQREGRMHSLEVWVNPYEWLGQRTVVVGTRTAVDATVPDIGQRARALTHGTTFGFDTIREVFETVPRLTPGLLSAALLGTRSSCVLKAHEGMSFGSTNLARVRAAAFGVPLESLWTMLPRLFEWLAREARAGRWVTSPIGLRFLGATRAHLSPARGRETCMVEVPTLIGPSPAEASRATQFFERMLAYLGAAVRPHWGQVHSPSLDPILVAARYGHEALEAFRASLDRLDPRGVFDNTFVRSLRTTRRPGVFGVTTLADHTRDDCHEAEVRSYSRLFCDPGIGPQRFVVVSDRDDEVLELLRGLVARGGHLLVRGSGHSMHTQALRHDNNDYIAVVARDHIHIDTTSRTMTVGAGARWGDIVDRAMARGLMPRVVTTSTIATVGGTLAANSIGQACRRFGHEANGLVSVKVALPDDGLDGGPAIVLLERHDPATAKLFAAVIRGYGHIGLILEATYELEPLPPSPVAVTTIATFARPRFADLVAQLKPTLDSEGRPIDDGAFKTGFLLLDEAGQWVGRVASTHYLGEAPADAPGLVTYQGPSVARMGVELMLTNMGTTRAANAIAARATAHTRDRVWVDPVRGHTFTMEANHLFKETMPTWFNRLFASTVQHTYAVPIDKAAAFIEAAIADLALPPADDAFLPTPDDLESIEASYPGFIDYLGRAVLEVHGFDDEADGPLTFNALDHALEAIKSMAELTTLVPVLFEMVWLPHDTQLLSCSYGQDRIAISLTFQGPGIDPQGPLSRLPAIARLTRHLYQALGSLAFRCRDLGGAMSLTKNIVGITDVPGYVRATLGEKRLQAFESVRKTYDPNSILRTRFGREVLGLDGPT